MLRTGGLGGHRGRPPVNRATWLTTVILGLTYAVAGFHHGVFEILQGNRPTGAVFIASIGPDHVRWEHGTDGAFTVIPNVLATGLAAALVSVAIVLWCVFGLSRRDGPRGFLALFVLLTLVGGGIGHVAFFFPAWAYATRIHAPMATWRRVLSPRACRAIARLWIPALAASSILFLLALEVSVFGTMPGVAGADAILAGIGLILVASLVTLTLAYVAAAARDLQSDPWRAGDPVAG